MYDNDMSRELGRNSTLVGAAILCSRMLGLVREVIFAALFGAGLAKDAFDVAFRIPNLLRDLFAEGAMSTAFVTTFSATKAREGDQRAFQLARRLITLLALVVGVVVLLGMIFSDDIVRLYASGFENFDGKTELTALLMQIMFPFLFLVSISSVLMGICNAYGAFGRPALAPAMFNVGTIIGGTACAFAFREWGWPMIAGMAVGTLIGGMLQWALLIPLARQHDFHMSLDWSPHDPGVQNILKLMLPAVLGLSAVQINILVTTGFASTLESGSISWLSYAFRLMQLPIGIFGVAIATAALPKLAELAAKNELLDFKKSLTEAASLCLVLTLPAAVGLWCLSEPIIRCIYRWMAFTETDVILTAEALRLYAAGLVSYAMVKIFAPAFYAHGQPRIPVIGTVLAITSNAILCALWIEDLKHGGLALATSVAASINLLWLLLANVRTDWDVRWVYLVGVTLRVGLASGAMLFIVNLIQQWSLSRYGLESQIINITSLAAAILAGMLTYGALCRLMKIKEAEQLWAKLLRRP